jgi:hypothetical protein
MTLGEITDELQKYCNMGYADCDVSIVNNSYDKRRTAMTVIPTNQGVTVVFEDREDDR